jgi:hypothetical protein
MRSRVSARGGVSSSPWPTSPSARRGDSSMREIFSPTQNAAKVAALLAREAELRKGARRVVGLRRKDRTVIETELAVIRRLLEQYGHKRSG